MIEGCRKQPCPEIYMNMSGKFNHVEKHLKSFSNLANRFNHYKYNRFIKKIVIWVTTTTGSKKGCRKRIFSEQHFCHSSSYMHIDPELHHSTKGPSIKDVRTRGGRGVSQKRTHADAGGRGVSGKKKTSSNLNFYQNFRSFNGVQCAKMQHLTQQLII